ncbi:MAG: aminoglycoside phosphotransferase family protein [Nannocystaceae bacterium]|nr:aminoglycoside phosphotransferase family protein [Nannocystaceae bacterium]
MGDPSRDLETAMLAAQIGPAAAWAHQQLRARGHDAVRWRPLQRGTTAAVYAAIDAEGAAVAVLKCARASRGFALECTALQRAAGLRGADGRPGCPELLAHAPSLRALLMTVVEGDDAVDLDLAHHDAVWHAAGQLRRRFDAIAIDDDAVPLSDAFARRFGVWLGRARAHLPPAIVQAVAARVDPSPLQGSVRRFCHRDFAPRNWRVASDGTVACVDFGHARGDHPWVDAVRACAPPLADPIRTRAFVRGWGVAVDATAIAGAQQLLLLHGLCTATWGRAHGAPEFVAAGDETLRRVLADEDVLALS